MTTNLILHQSAKQDKRQSRSALALELLREKRMGILAKYDIAGQQESVDFIPSDDEDFVVPRFLQRSPLNGEPVCPCCLSTLSPDRLSASGRCACGGGK